MLKLSKAAQDLLKRLSGDKPVMSKETRQNYRALESAYGRLVQVFLYLNQDAIADLSGENLDDIHSAISRIYESLYWARRSLTAAPDDGYSRLVWSLVSDRRDSQITESYKLVSNKLIRYCPPNLFLENSLIRLMNSYNIAADVTSISLSILAARRNRQDRDMTGKRQGQNFLISDLADSKD